MAEPKLATLWGFLCRDPRTLEDFPLDQLAENLGGLQSMLDTAKANLASDIENTRRIRAHKKEMYGLTPQQINVICGDAKKFIKTYDAPVAAGALGNDNTRASLSNALIEQQACRELLVELEFLAALQRKFTDTYRAGTFQVAEEEVADRRVFTYTPDPNFHQKIRDLAWRTNRWIAHSFTFSSGRGLEFFLQR